jgi:hypothetical protein
MRSRVAKILLKQRKGNIDCGTENCYNNQALQALKRGFLARAAETFVFDTPIWGGDNSSNGEACPVHGGIARQS